MGKGTTVSQNRQSQSPAFLIGRLTGNSLAASNSAKAMKISSRRPSTVNQDANFYNSLEAIGLHQTENKLVRGGLDLRGGHVC